MQMWFGKHLTLPCFAFVSSPCCRAEARDDTFEEISITHAYFFTLQTPCTVLILARIKWCSIIDLPNPVYVSHVMF